MKLNLKLQAIIGLTLFMGGLTMTSVAQTPKKPIPPKESVSTLKSPRRIPTVKSGQARLSNRNRHGFNLSVNNEVLRGNWKVQAKILSLTHDSVELQTAQGRTGKFVFRLPRLFKLKMSFKVDDVLVIDRKSMRHFGAPGYDLLVKNQKNLHVMAGQLFGSQPQEVKGRIPKVSLKQSQDVTDSVTSKYETHSSVPVILSIQDQQQTLELNKVYKVNIGKRVYQVLVTRSSKIEPTERYKASSEGGGYTFKYMIVQMK